MRVSVITVNYNNAEGLEKTIQSVLGQEDILIEYIAIDGGSTDGSVQVLEKFKDEFSYWISEKDAGVYDAMNKGIAKASGEYVIFLNSGDWFFNTTVLKDLLLKSSNEDLVYGNIVFKTALAEREQNYPALLDFNFFVADSLPHPCTLIKKILFQKYGNYKNELRICADWAFFLDAISHGATYKHVASPISVFVTGGLSSDSQLVKKEKEDYLIKFYGFYYSSYQVFFDLKERMHFLGSSRIIRLITKFLPARFGRNIYDIDPISKR